MRGTRFELDEQKASRLSGMSVDDVWNFINQKAKVANLIKIKNGEYCGKGDDKDVGYIGIFMVSEMVKIEWFTKSVKSWVEFDNDIEKDFIAISKELNKGVWE